LRARCPGYAIFFFGLAVCALAQVDLPEGKGRQTLENTCAECHGLDRALADMHTLNGWREIAVRMRSKGATMTDSELETLVDYLFQNFGIDEKARVNVNKASEKEIETGLEVTAAEAAAIVRHRSGKRPFKDWRDLTKVEGVDPAKIEARKDRLLF
jgi:competence protein ComEA